MIKKRRAGQTGQAVFETVLLMAVVVLAWNTAFAILKKNDFFQKTYGDTWGRVSTTIEFGIPGQRSQAAPVHPTSYERHHSPYAF